MRRVVIGIACALLASCGGGGRAEEPVATRSSGGVVVVEASDVPQAEIATSSGSCTTTVRVYDVTVREGCVIDERVTSAPGSLSYPCEGGAASATFGPSVFQGTVSASGEVTLDLQTGFDFSDRCHWTTKQAIRGMLGTGVLAYEYREEPDPGQHGCAAACVGTASVAVAN
ncbi:hypothetical protein [Sandaracinus amylolyticus]|uniref:hypothetical protein n=1 Tax=Sandaracinus amylolyticus TaxID=927083 RepID=UPI0012ED529F|nr:hypothetical protein [Sandaracinus amylolyticus]